MVVGPGRLVDVLAGAGVELRDEFKRSPFVSAPLLSGPPAISDAVIPSWASVASTSARNNGARVDGRMSAWFWKFFAHVTPLRWVQASEEELTTPEYSVYASVDALGRFPPLPNLKAGCWVKRGSASVNAAMLRFAFSIGGRFRFAACSIFGNRFSNAACCSSL